MSVEAPTSGNVSSKGGQVRSPRKARLSSPTAEVREVSPGQNSQDGSIHHTSQAGVLRRKFYDQNLADWSSRYRKNRQTLENLAKDCEVLRCDVAKQQQEVDERAESFRQLEEKFDKEVVGRFSRSKEAVEAAALQKAQLQLQLSEQRKQKAQLAREKKFLVADFERKQAEHVRTAEARDRLDSQLSQLMQQLGQLSSDRRRMERELGLVQHNLRANSELAGEVNNEIEHVFRSVKDSMEVQQSVHSQRETLESTPRTAG